MFDTIHPVVVHFPIALLIIYSLLELLSLIPGVRHKRTIWYIKLFLVVVGWIGVQAALQSGEAMKDAGYGVKVIIAWHELFGNISSWIYGIAALGYLLQWYLYDGIVTSRGQKMIGSRLHRIIQGVVFFYRKTGLYYLLALAGFAALMITGALGGAMVYGPNHDPMIKLITNFLPLK